jgi:hypothetical protein
LVRQLFEAIDVLSSRPPELRPETKKKLRQRRDEVEQEMRKDQEKEEKEAAEETKRNEKKSKKDETIASMSAAEQQKVGTFRIYDLSDVLFSIATRKGPEEGHAQGPRQSCQESLEGLRSPTNIYFVPHFLPNYFASIFCIPLHMDSTRADILKQIALDYQGHC